MPADKALYWLGVGGGLALGISAVLLWIAPGWLHGILFCISASAVATFGLCRFSED